MKLIVSQLGVRRGEEELAIGDEIEVDGDTIPDSLVNKVRVSDGRTAITNPAEGAVQDETYEAKHRGGGSYSVLDGDGKEVLEKLTKEQAEAFNALDAEERARTVAAAKA